MTEEVTDAMLSAGMEADGDWMNAPRERRFCAIYLAMEAARVPASNSPTTNGEVSEAPLTDFPMGYRPTSPARPKEFVERRARRLANITPRAASDDEVERLREALIFYAEEWKDGAREMGHALPARVPTHQLVCDYGDRARAALSVQRAASSSPEVERVARAIYDTDGYDEPFGAVSERTRERFIAMARAAIAPNGDD